MKTATCRACAEQFTHYTRRARVYCDRCRQRLGKVARQQQEQARLARRRAERGPRIGTCTECNGQFEHEPPRGRIPALCPSCRTREPAAAAPVTLECKQCGTPFESTWGRLYCGDDCRRLRYGQREAAKHKLWTEARREARRCECGSTDVKQFGKPVCPGCRRDNWRDPDRERAKHRRKALKRRGITMADFDRMLAEQGGRCAICGTEEPGSRQWNVDHCHETGRVRGLLCTACNTGIGHLRDDPGILLSAMTYLNDGQPVITLADRRAIRQLLARGRSLLESA